MNAVAAQFAHVRRTEATGQVQAQVQMVVGIPYGTDATRHTVEIPRVEIQMTMVVAQATV